MGSKFFEELSRCLGKEQIESLSKEDRRLEIFLHGQPVLSVSPGNEVFLLPAGSKNPEANELYHRVAIAADRVFEYVEAMENYTKIYRREKGYVLSRMSLKSILEMLPEQQFFRIHKSYIVPVHNVAGYVSHRVTLHTPSIELPIGRTYLPAFIEWIGK